MKSSILMNLILGVTIIFFSCSEDNLSVPEFGKSDQAKTSMKMEKTTFTGRSDPAGLLVFHDMKFLPNGNVLIKLAIVPWDDVATDWRVTGRTNWFIKQKIEADGDVKYGGKAELFVEGGRGKWEMNWHGGLTPDGVLVAEVIGTGKEGDVKGLVAKWTYTFHDDGTDIWYTTKGYVQSK